MLYELLYVILNGYLFQTEELQLEKINLITP